MELWKRIRLYKTALTVLWTINVFILVTGIVLSYSYWSSGFESSKERILLEQSQKDLFEGQSSLVAIQSILETKKTLEKKEHILFWRHWQKVEKSGVEVPDLEKRNSLPSSEELKVVQQAMLEEQRTAVEKSFHLVDQNKTSMVQLIVISVLTFLFGIGLPAFISAKLVKALAEAKRETEKTVAALVAQWNSEHSKDQEAFKNTDFWLKMVLLTTERLTVNSGHPMARYFGELSEIIRDEIARSKREFTVEKADGEL